MIGMLAMRISCEKVKEVRRAYGLVELGTGLVNGGASVGGHALELAVGVGRVAGQGASDVGLGLVQVACGKKS